MNAFVPLGESAADPADGTNGPLFVNNVNSANPADAQGHYAGTINNIENSDPRFAPGTRLYVMVLNAPFESRFTANAMAVFSDSTDYTIPSFGARTLTTSVINSPGEVVVGVLGPNSISMVPFLSPFFCPEPGPALLSVVSGVGLAARRRRPAQSQGLPL
jgi:hypothetical protein